MTPKTFIDNFDYELKSPVPKRRMTPDQRDIEILRCADRVSIFWITASDRRIRLIMRLEAQGRVELDNSCGYPWMKVVKVI